MTDDFGVGMGDSFAAGEAAPRAAEKHPEVLSIEDIITFRLRRLVLIGEREGHLWSNALFDLSLNEWRVLALVVARAPARAADIAEFLLMDKSQTSRLVKSLAGKGLITMLEDSADRRAHVLELTVQGAEVYHGMMAEVLRSNEEVLAPLSKDEVAVFSGMLQRLIDHNFAILQGRISTGE
ncbi:MAG: DNA-binding MarR family transcriptional regulator [Sulfitobacter sp.]|jgi:DNA-binding MarR family transcriptional regulator